MSNSDVILYVFLVFLALFFIWVGREFIRARRKRAQDEAAPEPESSAEPEAEAAPEPESSVEPEAEAGPEPAAKPEKVDEPKPKKLAEPEPEPVPKAKPEPKAEPKPAAKPEPAPALTAPALTVPVPKPTAVPVKKPLAEAPEPEAKRLRKGLAKTRNGFIARLGRLFRGKKTIDTDMIDHLEEVLFTADIGVHTSGKLFNDVKEALDRKSLKDPDAVWAYIKQRSVDILNLDVAPLDVQAHKPFVILTVGVNGVGKTTTIGKLASRFKEKGKKVLLAAGDTFRAAAVEQLTVWGQRTDSPVVQGKQDADPSSVVFDAIKKAQQEQYDVVIADTAGRLHTKVGLMDELKKIHRVTGKAEPGAPHETLLILDATTGQNAIQQALLFTQAVQCSGIVLTKLDGTAKGGIILGICDELKLPVRFVGIGERVEDLRVFNPEAFVEALYAEAQDDPD